MANSVSNVIAGKPLAAGGIYVAPLGTAAPADGSTALVSAYKSLGYVGEDGLTETIERSTEKIKAWGGDTVKVVQTEFGVQYKFVLIETANADVLKVVYGDSNVTTTAATSSAGAQHAIKVNSAQLPHLTWAFEIKDGDAKIRISVADGQVTEIGEITYSDESVVAYEVTIEAFADASGNQATKYITNGVKSAD